MLSINQLSRSKEHGKGMTANDRRARLQRSDRSYHNSSIKDQSYHNNKTNEGFRLCMQSSQVQQQSRSSRQLLKRCKQVIKQQMIQIHHLAQQNQHLQLQIANVEKRQIQLLAQIQMNTQQQNQQYTSCVQKNQILHKQLNRRSLEIEAVQKLILQREQVIRTREQQLEQKQERIRGLEQYRCKLQQQCQSYRQQITSLQHQLQQMINQNQQLQQIIDDRNKQLRYKQHQYINQLNKLSKVNKLIERNNRFQQQDQHKRNILLVNPKGSTNQYPTINKSTNFFTIQQQSNNPFKGIDINNGSKMISRTVGVEKGRDRNVDNSNNSNNRSEGRIVYGGSEQNGRMINSEENEVSSPNVARIRKNIVRSVWKDQSTMCKTRQKFYNSPESIIGNKHNTTNNNKPNPTNTKPTPNPTPNPLHNPNPQLQSQLSSLKQSIMQQYSLIETRKQKLNNERINLTLHQIESKLERMKFIVKDQTESQFQGGFQGIK